MTIGLALRLAHSIAIKSALALFCALCLAHPTSADWKSDIGYARQSGDTTVGFTHLVDTLNLLGIAVPNGNGVPISIVEAIQTRTVSGVIVSKHYIPDVSNADFASEGDPLSQAVDFNFAQNVPCSGCFGFSNHSTGQSGLMFGNLSVAPAANSVSVYEANYFLNTILNAPNGASPITQNFRVQNFSWIGSFDDTPLTPPTTQQIADDVQALRRFDFMINRDNITAVVGLNNNTDPLSRLLTQSYNAINVGNNSGAHGTGLTNLTNYGPGRSKPDVVGPHITSSPNAATTSAIATLLHSVVSGTDASKSQVIKAMIMAGATKHNNVPIFEEGNTQPIAPGSPFPWSRTTTQPLDDTYGAGQINVFNSYKMALGGRYAGSTSPVDPVGQYGWDFQSINPGLENVLKYNFVVPEDRTATELSILLTWNVNVISGFSGQTLTNLDLRLTDSLGQIVDQSLSTVDNVEHIYIGAGQGVDLLNPGTYTLTISTDAPKEFGLAWRMSTESILDSADFDGDGDIDGRDFLTWQRGFGTMINATRAMGDADGDGDVDHADLQLFQSQYNIPAVDPPAMTTYAVPEPNAAVLLAGGLLMFCGRRIGRKSRAPKPCFC